MAPRQKIHHPPPRLYCPVPGCYKGLQNKSGFTQHVQSIHGDLHSVNPLQPRTDPCALSSVEPDDHSSPPPPDDFTIPCLSDFHGVEDWELESFDFNVGSAEGLRFGPPLASSCRTSPSPCDEESPQGRSTEYHPLINGEPCSRDGVPLDPGSPPPAAEEKDATDWTPYRSRVAFELADFIYRRNQMSAGDFNTLCKLWEATLLEHADPPPFSNYGGLCRTIDETPIGGVTWESISLSYDGPRPNDSDVPSWMESTHEIWYRDPRLLFKGMLENSEFEDFIDYAPLRQYDAHGDRQYENVMSGNWAWKQADIISRDPNTHGAMFVPVILGSDKTTVSVATGHTEYWPLYASIGNIHNSSRRAHSSGLVLVAFLAIPKTNKEHSDCPHFRQFRRRLFHASLALILQSLLPGERTPEVYKCPDGHFRRIIWGLGPYIADYPEQVLLACLVQGWCPKCQAFKGDLDGDLSQLPRTRALTEGLIERLQERTLWGDYGIVSPVVPFTNYFERADIYELIAPDLLHQVIKGTFKDHLVSWVGAYLENKHGKRKASKILDDIDRRIANAPPFSGLRRFPQGRGFKQWTGNDSKALMKVYLPAIQGHVPSQLIRTFRAFLEFCYIARKNVITENDLSALEGALLRFYANREIIVTSGVREDILLPRQHSLTHYPRLIRLFGAPNGISSSITESKHIRAVKEPWRRSNRFEALGQMLVINQRRDQLTASRSDFAKRGMLDGPIVPGFIQHLAATSGPANEATTEANDSEGDHGQQRTVPDEDPDNEVVNERNAITEVTLPSTFQGRWTLDQTARFLEQAEFPVLVRRFLFDQLNPNPVIPSTDILEDVYPVIESKIHIFHSAIATFYAPSDISGVAGMRRKYIRATPSWRNGPARYDCVLVNTKPGVDGGRGFEVARVFLFFSFFHGDREYPCAFIQWYSFVGNEPDEDTGCWVIEPESIGNGGSPHVAVIHTDCILRAAHLMPVTRTTRFVDLSVTMHTSLDTFKLFYLNRFVDHHAFVYL